MQQVCRELYRYMTDTQQFDCLVENREAIASAFQQYLVGSFRYSVASDRAIFTPDRPPHWSDHFGALICYGTLTHPDWTAPCYSSLFLRFNNPRRSDDMSWDRIVIEGDRLSVLNTENQPIWSLDRLHESVKNLPDLQHVPASCQKSQVQRPSVSRASKPRRSRNPA